MSQIKGYEIPTFTVSSKEIDYATASRKINLLHDALNKPKPKIVTMREFCAFYEFDLK
ncbi:hypothetical protein FACS189413_18100 [Bacteroidia bacterium]|nr:hypothetical protein FACS189413_18100 [Bacteroidia bacterium]